jgi:hypothetical protein
MGTNQVSVEVEYPGRLNQVLIFVKWLLLLPHFIVLYVLGFVALLVAFLNWFAVLFTGRTPEGFFNFILGFERWRTRAVAYLFLMTDRYPPFSMADDPGYPVRMTGIRPERISRWRLLWQWAAVFLASIIALFLGLASWVTYIVAWFAILFTGRYPAALFEFNVKVLRFSARLVLYSYLVTTEFPSMDS